LDVERWERTPFKGVLVYEIFVAFRHFGLSAEMLLTNLRKNSDFCRFFASSQKTKRFLMFDTEAMPGNSKKTEEQSEGNETVQELNELLNFLLRHFGVRCFRQFAKNANLFLSSRFR
jgi:hypothetical protein